MDQLSAEVRRMEFLRPERLLPVNAVAGRLAVSESTIRAAISSGELRWILSGSARRARPEDLESFVQSRGASLPPVDEAWCTVVDLMQAPVVDLMAGLNAEDCAHQGVPAGLEARERLGPWPALGRSPSGHRDPADG